MTPQQVPAWLRAEFERGYVPGDEPPGLEEHAYRAWKESGGTVTGGDPNQTLLMVPLRELTEFARLVISMRKAQRAYVEKRRANRIDPATAELKAAQRVERAVDAACSAALSREQTCLPGMGDDGT